VRRKADTRGPKAAGLNGLKRKPSRSDGSLRKPVEASAYGIQNIHVRAKAIMKYRVRLRS